jgi:hypothetical protein
VALLLTGLPQLPQTLLTARGRTAEHASIAAYRRFTPTIAAAAISIARS